jgi:hypothetical protein
MSVRRKILEGTFFVTTATLLARAGTFLANVAMIRTLSQELVGQLGLIESWLNLMGVFAGVGMGIAVTKHLSQYLEADRSRVGSLAGSAILLTLLASVTVVAVGLLGLKVGIFALVLRSDSGCQPQADFERHSLRLSILPRLHRAEHCSGLAQFSGHVLLGQMAWSAWRIRSASEFGSD